MATRDPISARLRFEVFKRDGFRCVYCGAGPDTSTLHVDHRHPVAEGGTNAFDNLATACAACNSGKGAVLLAAPASVRNLDAERAARGARGLCPHHGLGLSQIDGWHYPDGAAPFTLVRCPRGDCRRVFRVGADRAVMAEVAIS